MITKSTISSCPYIVLPETWEYYQNHDCPNRKKLKQLRGQFRALQRDHTVEFVEFNGSDEELKVQLDNLYKLHTSRWLLKTGKSKFTQTNSREFYLEISRIMIKKGWFGFTSLVVDGNPVSMIWGFKYNNVWMDMTPVFDFEYARYSVGQIIIMNVVEAAIQQGMSKFDFLKGASDYKHRWTNETINNMQITIVANNFRANYRKTLLRVIMKILNFNDRSIRDNISLLVRKVQETVKSNEGK